jgi:hypothetical protein
LGFVGTKLIALEEMYWGFCPSEAALDFPNFTPLEGEFHDQADSKWIVIRGLLRGHNDTPLRAANPLAGLSAG